VIKGGEQQRIMKTFETAGLMPSHELSVRSKICSSYLIRQVNLKAYRRLGYWSVARDFAQVGILSIQVPLVCDYLD